MIREIKVKKEFSIGITLAFHPVGFSPNINRATKLLLKRF